MWQVSDLMQLSPHLNKLGNYFLSSLRTCMRFTFAFELYMTLACHIVICEHSYLRIPEFKALYFTNQCQFITSDTHTTFVPVSATDKLKH